MDTRRPTWIVADIGYHVSGRNIRLNRILLTATSYRMCILLK